MSDWLAEEIPATESPTDPAGPLTRPSLLVIGLTSQAEDEPWSDLRWSGGIRGRLAQLYADSRAFVLIEDKRLATDVHQAIGGYWLDERGAAELADFDRLRHATGADWIAYGDLVRAGVTRDRLTGPVGGRRWIYRTELRLCLNSDQGEDVCRKGSGRSKTRVISAGIEFRGEAVAFDQAGPAKAVDRALIDAFSRLLPAWKETR